MTGHRGDKLTQLALESRARQAEQLFDVDRVLGDIAARAAEGFRVMQITQKVPVSLDETPGAARLAKVLKSEGLTAEWVELTAAENDRGNPTGMRLHYKALRIKW